MELERGKNWFVGEGWGGVGGGGTAELDGKIKKTNSKTECVFPFSVSLSILTLGTNFEKG